MFKYLEHFSGSYFVRTPHLLIIFLLHTTCQSEWAVRETSGRNLYCCLSAASKLNSWLSRNSLNYGEY